MVDIITGSQLGTTSHTGTRLNLDMTAGQAQERITVNAVTGNLSIQRTDQILIGRGPDTAIVRTYNSQGRFDDENADNFRFSVQRRISQLTGTVNTAGSTVVRTAEDGSLQTFTYRVDLARYVSTDGVDAHDTLSYSSSSNVWTYMEGSSRQQERYESAGAGQWRLTQAQDSEGRTLTFAYNARGFVNRITDSSGQTTFIDFAGNNVSRIRTQSAGVEQTTTRYSYDTLGRLTQVVVDLTPADNAVIDGNIYTTTYTYDGTSFRVASITQSDDTVVSFTYRLVGSEYRVGSITRGRGADAVELRFAYRSGATDITRMIAPGAAAVAGPMTTVVYDAAGRLSQTLAPTDSTGRRATTTYTYDSSNNIQTIEESGSRTTQFVYDTSGNLLETWDAGGNLIARRTYRDNLLVSDAVFPRGVSDVATAQTTHYVRDSMGQTRFVVGADRRVVETRYADAADGTRVISTVSYSDEYAGAIDIASVEAWVAGLDKSRSQRTDTFLDFRGQALRTVRYDRIDAATGEGVVTPDTSTTHYVYDQWGRLLQTIDPRGSAETPESHTTQYVYDGMGRLTLTIDPQSYRTVVTYSRNTVITTYAHGLQKQIVYSSAGDVLRETQVDAAAPAAILSETRQVYDDLGRLRATIDASGAITHRMYDALGREVGRVEANGLLIETTYNLTNEKLQTRAYAAPAKATALTELVRQANSGIFTSTDGVWQLAQLRPAADVTNDRVNDFLYDNVGRLIYAVDSDHYVTETRYDLTGQVIETVRYDTALTLADRRARLWDPLATGGDPGAATYVRTYLASVATTASRRSTYLHDAAGRIAGVIDAEGYLTESVYNRFGQLTQMIRYGIRADAFDGTGRVIDPMMLAARDLAALRPTLSEDDVRTYTFYDGKGQAVLEIDVAGHLTVTTSTLREVRVREMRYDIAGNLVEKTVYGTSRFERGGIHSYEEFAAYIDELESAAGEAQRLNLAYIRPTQTSEQALLNEVSQYQYDNRRQLIRTTNAEGTDTTYAYDAAGRRTHTTVADGTTESRTTTVEYDVLGRVRSTITPLAGETGARITNRYDVLGRVVQTTDEVGNHRWNYYSSDGLLAYQVDGEGYVTQYLYNTFGEVIETVRYANRVSGDLSTLAGGLVDGAFTSRVTSSTNDIRIKQTYTRRGAVYQSLSAEAAGRGASASVINLYNAFGEVSVRQRLLDVRPGATDWLVTTYSYDRRGLVTATTAPGVIERAEYDTHGHVRKTFDARGYASFINYDGFGRTIETIDAGGGRRLATYDPTGRLLTERDANGQVTHYQYDLSARSVTVITPEGISVTTLRNRHGQTVQIIDGKGQISAQYEYDANGNAVGVLDALGARIASRYDSANRLCEIEDALGRLVTYEYDGNNRVVRQVTDPAGFAHTTAYRWDAFGRQIEVTDANGNVRRMQYNKDGQLIRTVVDPAGLKLFTDYAYDLAGRRLRTTQGLLVAGLPIVQRELQTHYDALNRVIREVVDPAGLNLITQYAYDASGNRTSTTNAAGDISYALYDSDNRPVYALVPLRSAGTGAVEYAASQTRYDGEGRVVSVIQYHTPIVINDTNRHLTTNLSALRAYLDARTTTRDRVVHNVYDNDGRLAYIVDPERSLVQRMFDANGNVIETIAYAKALPASVSVTKEALEAWVANPVNRSINDQHGWFVVDANNRRVYQVDALGYVTQTQYDTAGQVVRTVQYANAIDPATQRAADVIADAANDRSHRIVYDAAGRGVYELDSLGFVTHHQYDAVGHVTQTTRYKNAVVVGSLPTQTEVAAAIRPHAQDQINRSFYDAAGRMIYALDALSHLTSFTYDALSQVVGERRFYVRYTGALTITGLAAHGTNARDYVTATDYDKAGRVIAAYDGSRTDAATPVERLAYDALGNLVKKTDRRGHLTLYGYDKASRLIRTVRQKDAGSPGPKLQAYVVDYEYDALGNQVAQTQYMNPAFLYYLTPGGVVAAYSAMQVVVTPNTDPVSGDRLTRYTYNRRGQQTQVKHAISSIVTRTDYDAFGRSVRVVEALGLAEQRVGESVYDRRNQQVATVTAVGTADAIRVELHYDAFGQVVEEVGANGIALAESDVDWASSWRTSHGYASNADRLTAADKDRLRGLYTTRYTYDQLGNRTSVIEPQWGADLTGRVPMLLPTATTSLVHDGNGNVIRTTDAAGNQRFYYYDLNNRLRIEVDELGFAKRYEYDTNGNVIELRGYATALGAGTYDETMSHDEILSLLVPDALDQLTQNSYDARGRRESTTYAVTDTLVYREQFTYDSAGNRVSFTNKNGHTFNFDYDALNRMIREVMPSALTVVGVTSTGATKSTIRLENRYEYDAVDQRVSEYIADNVDSQRQVRRNIYDKLGREVEQQVEEVAVYDVATSTETTRTAITRRLFDAHGQVLRETDAAGNRTFHFYDSAGRKIAFVDALNVLHTTVYDATGSALIERTYGMPLTSAPTVGGGAPTPPAGSDVRSVYYVRDAKGRAVRTRTDNVVMFTLDRLFYERPVETQYVYDYRGNVIQYLDGEGNKTHYFYDRAGNAVLEIDTEGYAIERQYGRGDGLATREVRFSNRPEASRLATLLRDRDLDGLLTEYRALATGENRVTLYQYDRLGRLTKQTLKDVAFHKVDAATGELSSVTTRIPIGGGLYLPDFTPDISTTYEHDGEDNLLRVTAPDGTSQTKKYDALNRVTATLGATFVDYLGESAQEKTEYFYTAHGQVAETVRFGSGAETVVTRAAYDRHGQLKETWDPEHGARLRNYYDVSGNLVRSCEQVYQRDGTFREDVATSRYDALNRLVVMQDPTGIKHALVYNAYGDVARRGKYVGRTAVYQEFFVYDAAGRLHFTNAEDGTLKMRYYDDNGNLTLEIKSGQRSLDEFLDLPDIDDPKTSSLPVPPSPESPKEPPMVPKNPSKEATIDPSDKADMVPMPLIDDLVKDILPFDFLDIDYRVRNDVVWGLSPSDVEFSVYHYDKDYRLVGMFAQPKHFGDMVPGSVPREEHGLYYLKALRDYHDTLEATGVRPADDSIIYRSHAYNAFGEIISQTDARGNTTNLAYNKLGNVIERTDPEVDVYVYSAGVETSASGKHRPISQFYYDNMGRRIGARDARGNLLETVLIDNGRSRKTFRGGGLGSALGTVDYAYDGFGHLRRETATVNYTESEVLTSEYTYDANGNRTAVAKTLTRGLRPHFFTRATDAERVTDVTVDGVALHGELETLSYVRESYLYDNHGNRIVHVDGAGRRESYVYDQANRIIEHNAIGGVRTRYGYLFNTLGGFTETELLSGVDTRVDWKDYFGRTVQHKDLGNQIFSYVYNNAGWLKEYQHALPAGAVESLQVYEHFDNGWQRRAVGNGATEERYDYDLNGNRTYEYVSTYGFDRDPHPDWRVVYAETFQESRIAYDAMNRVTSVTDPFYRLYYQYDEMGNRTRIDSHFRLASTAVPESDPASWGEETGRTQFFTYDALNRLSREHRVALSGGGLTGTSTSSVLTTDTLLEGPLDGEIPEYGVDSRPGYFVYGAGSYLYDHFDRRTLSSESGLTYAHRSILEEPEIAYWSTSHRYHYNVLGLVEGIETQVTDDRESETILQFRDYDAAGNLTYKVENKQSSYAGSPGYRNGSKTLSVYDTYGKITREHELYWSGHVGTERHRGVRSVYDTRLRLESTQAYGDSDTRVEYTYAAFDSYQISELRQTSGGAAGRGIYTYDVQGRVQHYRDEHGRRETQYINRLDGKTQARLGGSDRVHFAYLGGRSLGHVGTWRGAVDFGFAQVQDASSIPGAVQSYEVREGDTLSSIAASAYGDASLWYVIADANGLGGDETLVPGTRLTIPTSVSSHNNADNFRPYDSRFALGNNSIGLQGPPPSCEQQAFPIIAAIIAIVVAIVVAVVSYGTLSGVSVGLGLLASAGIGAAAGATTSVATQGIAMAMGLQKEFDWAALGTATLMGALSGLGSYGLGQLQQVSAVAQAMNGVSGLVLNAVKGAAVAAIEQASSAFVYETFDSAFDRRGFDFGNVTRQFDWRVVAMGAIQGLGQSLMGPLNTREGGAGARSLQPGDFGRSMLYGLGTAAFNEGVRVSIYRDSFNPAMLLTNGLGNTLNDFLSKGAQIWSENRQRARREREHEALQRSLAEQRRTFLEAHAARVAPTRADDFDTFLRETLDPLFAAEREELLWQDLDATLGLGGSGDYAIVEGSLWETLRGRSSDTRALLQATRYANGDDVGPGSFIFIPDESNFTAEQWGELRREGIDYVRARERHRAEVEQHRLEASDIAMQEQYTERLHQLEEELQRFMADGSLQAYFDSRMSSSEVGAIWSEYEALSSGRSWAGAPLTDDRFALMVFDSRARDERRAEMTRLLMAPPARAARTGNPSAVEELRDAIISLGGDSDAGQMTMGVLAGAFTVVAEPVGWVVDLAQVGYHAVVDPEDYNPYSRDARFASDMAAYIVHETGAGNRSSGDVSANLLLDMAIDIPTLGLRHVPDQLETLFGAGSTPGERGVALFNFGFTVFGAVDGIRAMPRMARASASRLGLGGLDSVPLLSAAEGPGIFSEMAFTESGGPGGPRPPRGSGGTGGPHGPLPESGGTEFLRPEHLESARTWYENQPRPAPERWSIDEVMARVERDALDSYLDQLNAESVPDSVSSPILQSEATGRLLSEYSRTASGLGEIRPNALERAQAAMADLNYRTGGRITRYSGKILRAVASGGSWKSVASVGLEAAADLGSFLYKRMRSRSALPETSVPVTSPVSGRGTTYVTPDDLRWFLR